MIDLDEVLTLTLRLFIVREGTEPYLRVTGKGAVRCQKLM